MQSQLFILRHGVTPANNENRFAGRTNEPLHQDGREQIAQVAQSLQSHDIEAVFCGPSTRTTESAEIIGTTNNAPVCPMDAFDEIYLPHWDGLTKNEIRSRFGPQYPTWLEHPDEFLVPGCETLDQVQKRAVSEVEKILSDNPGKKAALVSHLIVLRCLVLHYKDLGLKEFRKIKINNGDVTILSRSANGETSVNGS